jgi:release factor glutamine methyltransferase
VPGACRHAPGRPAIAARLRAAGCVFAEDEADLLQSAARTPAELTDMVEHRAAGLPLERVLGWADFCGLRLVIEPAVFIPRRRTEFLVRQAAALVRRAAARAQLQGRTAPGAGRPAVLVDLCCGSGAVGAALAAELGEVELHAVDIDPAAVQCARRNLPFDGRAVYQGDLYQPLPARLRGRVDVLTANVPYVPSSEIAFLPAEARSHEPRAALDGGPDGLDVLRRVSAGALQWLAPGGSMLSETSEHQARRAAAILVRAGLMSRVASSARLQSAVVVGTKAAA